MPSSELVEVEDSEIPVAAWEALELAVTAHQATSPRSRCEAPPHRWPAAQRPWRDLYEENARLRKAAKHQSELLATVAHDLHTPLVSVIGFAELLLTRRYDEAAQRSCLEIITGEMRRFGRLIDDLFEEEPAEEPAAPLPHGLFDLSRLLSERVEIFRTQSDAHQLRLAVLMPALPVRADREQIARVVDNLLSNAIKYTPDGGAIVIGAETHDGTVRISVHDDGLGIPAEQQHLIFGRFFRTEGSRASGIEGTGLGLAISREIVRSHGGAIGFDSTDGGGSTFWFELPSARA
jgi:signal transduction histidine kinase